MSTERTITVSSTLSNLGRDTGPEFTASYRLRGTDEFTGSGDFSKESLIGKNPENVPLSIHTASVEFKIENYDPQNPGGDTLSCTNQFTASICDTPVHLIEENVKQTVNDPYKIQLEELDLGETEPESLDIFITKPSVPTTQQRVEEVSIEEPIEFNLDNEEFDTTEDFTISIRKRCNTGSIDGSRSFSTPRIEIVRNNNEVSKPKDIVVLERIGNDLIIEWNTPFRGEPDRYEIRLEANGILFDDIVSEPAGTETQDLINLCDQVVQSIIPPGFERSIRVQITSKFEAPVFDGVDVSTEPVLITGCDDGTGESGGSGGSGGGDDELSPEQF